QPDAPSRSDSTPQMACPVSSGPFGIDSVETTAYMVATAAASAVEFPRTCVLDFIGTFCAVPSAFLS
ncbi:MAG: hypothetical protein ACXVCT_02295, partial [Ktedonobacterales bacterium]